MTDDKEEGQISEEEQEIILNAPNQTTHLPQEEVKREDAKSEDEGEDEYILSLLGG